MMYTIVSKPNCGYCTAAKNLLKNRGLEFQEFDWQSDQGAYLVDLAYPWKSYPFIWDQGGERFIGGFRELVGTFGLEVL